MPYPQRRCIVEIEFRGGKGTGGSVPGRLFCFVSGCCSLCCGGLQSRQGGAQGAGKGSGCSGAGRSRAAPEEAVRGAGAGAQAAACSGGGGAYAGRLFLGGAGGRAGLGRGVHRGDAGR
jgi:hypothetical protein